jgi:hypothetical protein
MEAEFNWREYLEKQIPIKKDEILNTIKSYQVNCQQILNKKNELKDKDFKDLKTQALTNFNIKIIDIVKKIIDADNKNFQIVSKT